MTVIHSTEADTNGAGFQHVPLWTGPSKLLTVRTARKQPFDSLLKPTFKDPTGFKKRPRKGVVHLGHYGFDSDERAYVPHQIDERAVLQYNPDHYPEWKAYLKDIRVKDDDRRDALLDVGGFGENIVVENASHTPPMDETSMCIGDLVGFKSTDGTHRARIRVNGARMPCYKLNHRFGLPSMSQKTQEKGWTGWLYSVEEEGDVEVGDQMVLLERPFPDWPVSRVQYYCYKEPRNMEMIKAALDTMRGYLATDVKELFEDRLTKGMEDMSLRLRGDQPNDVVTDFRLCNKIRQTDRVSEFVFERIKKLPSNSKSFATAKSGSHVRLRFKVNGQAIVRPYSIISGDSNKFSLGVALADNSRGGSSFIHQTLKVNDIIKASETYANTFALQTENVNEHIFLAGGIGITAFLDHMKHCVDTKQRFHLHYLMRSKSDYAFKDLIEKTLAGAGDTGNVTVYMSADGNRCDLKQLLTNAACESRTHIYVCGSERLSEGVKESAKTLNIPDSRLHFEQFSIDASGDPFIAETSLTKKKVEVNNRQSLLDALRDAGLDISSSCEAGNCGTCKIRVKCGRVLHKGTGLLEEETAGYGGREEGEMLSCVSRGIGTITIEV